MDTITLTIPANWLDDQVLDENDLRQALKIGLAQLRDQQQKTAQKQREATIQTLLKTGRIKHLMDFLTPSEPVLTERQPPPTLPGPPVSELLIAQRQGEL